MMTGVRKFHIEQFSDGGIPEPGKLLKREEEFTAVQQQPKPVLRNVDYFNL
jgi:hypothetical protein